MHFIFNWLNSNASYVLLAALGGGLVSYMDTYTSKTCVRHCVWFWPKSHGFCLVILTWLFDLFWLDIFGPYGLFVEPYFRLRTYKNCTRKSSQNCSHLSLSLALGPNTHTWCVCVCVCFACFILHVWILEFDVDILHYTSIWEGLCRFIESKNGSLVLVLLPHGFGEQNTH